MIADCDTGYGNALNVMRTVNDRERAGVAAICIEDNVYPKRCSFYAGVRRELIPIEEHCGKIQAAKAAQIFPEFMVIARTEALIAGWGQEEALKRAEAYADAGADAVLIHSKSKKFDELKAVYKLWSGRVPLVVVPTIFDQTTARKWKKPEQNHHLCQPTGTGGHPRNADTLDLIKKDTRPGAANDRIVTLPEVYDIVGVPQMEQDEKQFLPVGSERITAIIAAAGFEKQLLPLIEDKPNVCSILKGRPSSIARSAHSTNVISKKLPWFAGTRKKRFRSPISGTTTTTVTKTRANSFVLLCRK